MNNDKDNLKKKLIYRSQYRGTKEMDSLIGSFTKAPAYLPSFSLSSSEYSTPILLPDSSSFLAIKDSVTPTGDAALYNGICVIFESVKSTSIDFNFWSI